MSVSVMQMYSRSMSVNSLDSRGPPNVMPDEPVKPRVRPDGRQYYEKDRVSSEIQQAFQWDPKEDTLLPLDTVQRKRIRQKNFITLNRDDVKRIEDKVKTVQKSREELRAELSKPLWKSDKYDGVASKVAKEIAHLPSTANGHKMENGIQNGPARPSRRQNSAKIPNGFLPGGGASQGHDQRSKSVEPCPISAHAKKDAGHKNNFIQANAQAAARTSIKRAPSATEMDDFKKKIDDAFKNHPHGQMPEYLKSRKKAWMIANEPPKSPEAPPGHVLMNVDEKNKTLSSLKRAEADLLKRFNSLPVRTDTEFLRRKKQVLLRHLGEVDEAIKIFSRPKVYIKTDQF